MDEKRMGEIALALAKYRVRMEPVHLHPNVKRELGNMEKATGIPLDELKLFSKTLIEEAVEETFGS